MNREECKLLIPQYLAGQLEASDRRLFEEQLRGDAELRAEVEELTAIWDGMGLLPEEQPSPAMRARFYQTLNALSREPRPAPSVWWKLRPWHACALTAVVFVAGLFAGRSSNSMMVAQEVEQLRGEVQSMRQMVTLSLLDRRSANARLEGVSWGSRVDQPDREVSSALLSTLNHDPNVNVRLSAVDALQKFASDPAMRTALLEAVATQESPLVQIALIDTLVQIHDTNAGPEFQRIARDAQYNRNVRQRAQWGVQKLGLQ